MVIFATSVHAQDKAPKSTAKIEGAAASLPDGNYEYVTPSISAGSAAFETLIAHRVASDQLMVNGYDLLKLEDSILGVLISNRMLTPEQARKLAEDTKVPKPLRLQPPPPPK
jgi:hypothetical protein